MQATPRKQDFIAKHPTAKHKIESILEGQGEKKFEGKSDCLAFVDSQFPQSNDNTSTAQETTVEKCDTTTKNLSVEDETNNVQIPHLQWPPCSHRGQSSTQKETRDLESKKDKSHRNSATEEAIDHQTSRRRLEDTWAETLEQNIRKFGTTEREKRQPTVRRLEKAKEQERELAVDGTVATKDQERQDLVALFECGRRLEVDELLDDRNFAMYDHGKKYGKDFEDVKYEFERKMQAVEETYQEELSMLHAALHASNERVRNRELSLKEITAQRNTQIAENLAKEEEVEHLVGLLQILQIDYDKLKADQQPAILPSGQIARMQRNIQKYDKKLAQAQDMVKNRDTRLVGMNNTVVQLDRRIIQLEDNVEFWEKAAGSYYEKWNAVLDFDPASVAATDRHIEQKDALLNVLKSDLQEATTALDNEKRAREVDRRLFNNQMSLVSEARSTAENESQWHEQSSMEAWEKYESLLQDITSSELSENEVEEAFFTQYAALKDICREQHYRIQGYKHGGENLKEEVNSLEAKIMKLEAVVLQGEVRENDLLAQVNEARFDKHTMEIELEIARHEAIEWYCKCQTWFEGETVATEDRRIARLRVQLSI